MFFASGSLNPPPCGFKATNRPPDPRGVKTYVKSSTGTWTVDVATKEFRFVYWLGGTEGSGDVACTATDLWRLDRALHRGLLTPAARAEMHTPVRLNDDNVHWETAGWTRSSYGLGWSISADQKALGHTGDWGGAIAWFTRYPETERVSIVLQNHRSTDYRWVRSLESVMTSPLSLRTLGLNTFELSTITGRALAWVNRSTVGSSSWPQFFVVSPAELMYARESPHAAR